MSHFLVILHCQRVIAVVMKKNEEENCWKQYVKLKQQHPVYIFNVSGLINAVTERMSMISIGRVY